MNITISDCDFSNIYIYYIYFNGQMTDNIIKHEITQIVHTTYKLEFEVCFVRNQIFSTQINGPGRNLR